MMSAQPLCSCSTMHWQPPFSRRTFSLWISKKNRYVCVRVCENVKMCVHWEVCEWQRGSSLAPAFLSAAVGRAISADSGWDVAGARGLRGFLGGPRVALSPCDRERWQAVSAQGTGGQPARDICIHSGQRLIRAQKNTPSRNALRPRSHTRCTHAHTRAYVDSGHTWTHKTPSPGSTFPGVHTVCCTFKRLNGKSTDELQCETAWKLCLYFLLFLQFCKYDK